MSQEKPRGDERLQFPLKASIDKIRGWQHVGGSRESACNELVENVSSYCWTARAMHKHVLVYLVFRGRKLSIQLAVSKGVPGSFVLSNVEPAVLAWSILCSTF
jgi:hypothetical protein